MTTGYNIHEGSVELARRRAASDLDHEVAAAMLRRLNVQQLWRLALLLLLPDEPRPASVPPGAAPPRRGSFHPESLRA
jgi:hypothetical protein